MSEYVEGHYYSWNDGFSTDPHWRSIQKHGPQIQCDGIDYSWVIRCLTGKNGFIERIAVDADNRPIFSAKQKTPVTTFVVGHVTLKPSIEAKQETAGVT